MHSGSMTSTETLPNDPHELFLAIYHQDSFIPYNENDHALVMPTGCLEDGMSIWVTIFPAARTAYKMFLQMRDLQTMSKLIETDIDTLYNEYLASNKEAQQLAAVFETADPAADDNTEALHVF